VSLVLILDADKEGFLRAERSLIQTCGRAARNERGKVIMYGDRITRSMQVCLDETARRRKIQDEHNKKHGITPMTVRRKVSDLRTLVHDEVEQAQQELAASEARPGYGSEKERKGRPDKKTGLPFGAKKQAAAKDDAPLDLANIPALLTKLKAQMKEAAADLNFEKAASLRDRIRELEQLDLMMR
jgi:excinuclease ABC subunit B